MVQAPDGRLFLLTNHTDNNVIVYDRSGEVLGTWGSEYAGCPRPDPQRGGRRVVPLRHRREIGRGRQAHARLAQGARSRPTAGERGTTRTPPSTSPPRPRSTPTAGSSWPTDTAKTTSTATTLPAATSFSFAGSGTGPVHLDCAQRRRRRTPRTDVPTLLVTSRSQQEFKRYSLDGELLATYPTPGLWICRPVIRGDYTYFAVIVTETWYGYDGMVAIFDADMRLVSAPGSASESIEYSGTDLVTPVSDEMTFMNPHDVCVDADENLFVPQWYSGRTYPVMLERV